MRTINYKVSYEKLISRLPGLFAFLEIDSNGTAEIVKATRGKQGNYGKIVANIDLRKVNDLVVNEKGYIFQYNSEDDSIDLNLKKKAYSYRTLIDTYYKAIKDKEWSRNENGEYNEPFLKFIERGIGLKHVDLSEKANGKVNCGIEHTDKFPLAPDYIYLGEAKTLYNKIFKIKKQVEFYEGHTKFCKDDDKWYQSLKDEFEKWNGEHLLNILCNMIKEADSIAEEYLGYTDNSELTKRLKERTELTLDFNINLTNTIRDLGMVTPYIQEWIPGKRYYDGDVVYHIDDNGYGMTWVCKLPKSSDKSNNNFNNFDELGRAYTEGQYDIETELIYFEDGNPINYANQEIQINKFWFPQSLNWVDKMPNLYSDDEINNGLEISGYANSHLTSLRRFESYMNKDDSAEDPSGFKDWLWYYRKGYIANREAKYDELSNLTVMYEPNRDKNDATVADDTNKDVYYNGVESIIDGGVNIKWNGNTSTNLAVWGDVITDISAENNKPYNGVGTLTFKYVLGAHLTAEKGYSYSVTKEFDDDKTGTIIDVGGEIDKTLYENLPDKDKSKFDVRYYISKDGNDTIIDAHTYNNANDKSNYEPQYYEIREKEGAKSCNIPAHYDVGDTIDEDIYNRHKDCCSFKDWYSKDDDWNYKYYFKNFKYDTNSKQGVKYEESYIYYQGDIEIEVLEYFEDSSIRKIEKNEWIADSDFKTLRDKYRNHDIEKTDGEEESEWPQHFQKENGDIKTRYKCQSEIKDDDGKVIYENGVIITIDEYNSLKTDYKTHFVKVYQSAMTFEPLDEYFKGDKIDYSVWKGLKEYNKKKCHFLNESIWTLKEQSWSGYKDKFDAYINGVFDKDFKPMNVKAEDKNAPYYYLLYDKMEFDTSNNVHTYDFKVGGYNEAVQYRKTNFTTNIDIKHVDFEYTPLIRYDYYNGVSFQPNVNDDVNIERGVTQAFEKHIKFGEIKTLEDMENFANGSFFVLSKEDIDLG